MESCTRSASVVVIGAGQAGLSAAYHLHRRGFLGAVDAPDAARTFVVLDADAAPGGAWQHRWPSLTMATVNGIFDLPGMRKPPLEADEPSRGAVPRYFAGFERAFALPILRPVRVRSVRRADADPHGELIVDGDGGSWRTRAVINATGTWDHPVVPFVHGADRFAGRQFHTRDYPGAEAFAGGRVAIVGGGISALQHLEEVSRVAETFWYTRREPVFREGPFEPETTGRETIARVTADVEAGLPSRSIVSYTGLVWTPEARDAQARGVLTRRPMFTAIEPHGVREADGALTAVDAILWATGFRPAVRHLAPLGLHGPAGGIRMRGTAVAAEPRVHLIGFGPSQSTVGANRAGRAAVAEIVRLLEAEAGYRHSARAVVDA